MGAQEIIKILNDIEEPLTSSEIAEISEVNGGSVRRILRALVRDSSVDLKSKSLTFKQKKKRYGKSVPILIKVYWLRK